MFVYVISKDGQPLMPTTRFGKVRRLLKNKKAKVIRSCPFTIKLLYEPENLVVQEVVLGQDTGSKHVGTACVANNKVLYQSEVTLRDDIKKKHFVYRSKNLERILEIMINFAENEKRGKLSIKEKVEEAKMIADNHNLNVVMFLYKELGEVKLSTAYFSDMDNAEAYYDDRCKYMLGQYWSYMGYINGMWNSKRGVYVEDLEREIA